MSLNNCESCEKLREENRELKRSQNRVLNYLELEINEEEYMDSPLEKERLKTFEEIRKEILAYASN